MYFCLCVCVCALALPYDCDVLNNVTVLGETCNFLVQFQLIHCVCCVVLFNCKMLFIYFCIVTAYDVDRFAVTWKKDGRTLYLDAIQAAPKDPRILVRSSDSALIVTNVTASDSGRYCCSYSSDPPVKLMHVINVFGKRNKAQYACACLDGRSRHSD